MIGHWLVDQVVEAVERRAEVEDVNLAMQKVSLLRCSNRLTIAVVHLSEAADRRFEAAETIQKQIVTHQKSSDARVPLRGRWIWKVGVEHSATSPSLCVWQVGAVSGSNRLVPWSHQVPSLVLKPCTEQRVCRCSATLGSVWIGKQVAQHLQSGSRGFIGFLSDSSSRSKRSRVLRFAAYRLRNWL